MADVNAKYYEFHKKMMGYRCFLEGKEVAKSTLFWMQQGTINTSKRLANVVVKPR